MRLISIAIGCATMLLGAASPASARPFDALWVFGDSTVDTGWYNYRPSGQSQFDQYLSTYNLARPRHVPPTYGIGKPTSSPGPVSVEVLGALIGTEVLPADTPFLIGTFPGAELFVSFPRPPIGFFNFIGTNYATGGARNHDVNTPATGLFPNAVPTETQISDYLLQHVPDGQSLYLISSGGNDVGVAPNMTDPTTYITGVADSLAASIATLQQRGARFIIVADLPESFGTAQEQTYRHLYNTELMSQLNALGVHYAWGDLNGLRQQIVANPASFGITHTTNDLADRACTTPDPSTGITSAWAYLCSPISPVSQPISATFAEQALFADNEHWATGGQQILGTYYFCLAEKTWPQQFFGFRIIPPIVALPPPCGGTSIARAP
jgi:phospholipase/lecithinase/hemolysin